LANIGVDSIISDAPAISVWSQNIDNSFLQVMLLLELFVAVDAALFGVGHGL